MLVYLLIIEFRIKIRVILSEKTQEVDTEKPLFLIRAFGKSPVSLLSPKFTRRLT